ncbi:MAG: DUF397 domain-containing protein [Kibdelosporangium sp.]
MKNEAGWRKSSYSGNEGACVEVDGGLHRLRDSKNPSVVLTAEVRSLLEMVRTGQLGR